MLCVGVTPASEILCELREFYEAHNYNGTVEPDDVVFVAMEGSIIVGAVRLCEEEGVYVLRGMQVLEGRQRQGIGRRILILVSNHIRKKECWCISGGRDIEGLRRLYGNIGFRPINEEGAPYHLHARIRIYRKAHAAQGDDKQNEMLVHLPQL